MNGFLKPTLFLLVVGTTSPVWMALDKYLWHDKDFILLLAALMAADTFLAIIYHVANKTFSSKKFLRLWIKICVVALILNVTHFLRNHNAFDLKEGDLAKMLVNNLDYFSYNWVVIRELMSINRHASNLGYPLVPPAITEKIEIFLRKALKMNKIPSETYGKDDNDARP